MPRRACEGCGRDFLAMREAVKLCRDCRTVVCENCGKSKLISSDQLHQTRFCSRACRVEWNASHVEERFWSFVDKSGECWVWTAGTKNGYGVFHPKGGVWLLAHRYSYELANGTIPGGLFVLHECDNPPCVRHDHLFLGTHADNIHDSMRKGRARSYSAVGEEHHNHKVTEDDVRQLRALYDAGGVGCTTLGRMFGIHEDTARQIAKRKTWKHV